MKVMKFGGACLTNGEDILKIASIVKEENEPVALVISAINNVTNLLIKGLDLALESEEYVPLIIEEIRERHQQIIQEAITEEERQEEIITIINEKIQKLERLYYGVAFTEEIIDSIRAIILSYGEALATKLVAFVLRSQGINAQAKESNEIGIITTNSFTNATAKLGEIKDNLQKSLLPFMKEGGVPVITGFYGCTPEGKITIFGRNGTDYSAAVIAYGVDVQELVIWKNVAGFMTADPKLVSNARKISQLSFYEAAELAYFGATILHPRTLAPLIDSQINIEIRDINDPKSAGTKIHPMGYKKDDIIKSVTYNEEIAVLKIQGPGVGYKPGIIGKIGNKLAEIGVNIFSVITAQTCINLLLHRKDGKKSQQAIQGLLEEEVEQIIIEEDIALIAVVGEGLLTTKGLAAKVFSAVAEQNVNIEMISAGASEVAYYFIIKQKSVEVAIKAIHSKFFGKRKKTFVIQKQGIAF